ncbi:MAG: hypothetical protein AAF078_14140, partial [Planctomycetota bacterium]
TLREEERFIQYHEQMIAEPAEAFRAMYAFLGVEPNEQAVQACAGKIWQKPNKARKATDWPQDKVAELNAIMADSPLFYRYARPAPPAPPRPVPVASPAASPITPRPRDDDRTGYFDQLKSFCLLASPSDRGVGRFAFTISNHPDVVLGDELADASNGVGYLRDPYAAGQLHALIHQQHFRLFARDARRNDDPRRSIRLYKEVQERQPHAIGCAPTLDSVRALATEDGALDRLREKLGLPLRVIFFFPLLRKAEREARARQAATWREANVHSMTDELHALRDRLADDEHLTIAYDQLQHDPEDVFRQIYTFLNVPTDADVIDQCAAAFRKQPRAYVAKPPWWLTQARNFKQSLKKRGLINA